MGDIVINQQHQSAEGDTDNMFKISYSLTQIPHVSVTTPHTTDDKFCRSLQKHSHFATTGTHVTKWICSFLWSLDGNDHL